VKASLAKFDPGAAGSGAPQGANPWVTAGPQQAQPPAMPTGVPVWEQSEEQRRGW
jgi:hypothetical protein